MANKQRKFSARFKAEAVQLVVQGEQPVARVAQELEINQSTLGYWVKAYRAKHGLTPDELARQDTPTPVAAARIAALEAENRRLAEENAFLKKAAALFAREQRRPSHWRSWHACWMSPCRGTTSGSDAVTPLATGATARGIERAHRATAQGIPRHERFPRILAALHAEGVSASAVLVRSIMAQLGIFGIQPRSKKPTTIPAQDVHTHPDLVRRDFTAAEPATKPVGDITYLRTSQGGCIWQR